MQGNTGEPMYVTAIDADANRVILGRSEDLMRRELWASRINYVAGEPPDRPVEVTAKIRYKASEAPATLTPRGDWAELRFHEPQRAVTPGQAVTFYQDEEIIGGGIIEVEAPEPVEVFTGR